MQLWPRPRSPQPHSHPSCGKCCLRMTDNSVCTNAHLVAAARVRGAEGEPARAAAAGACAGGGGGRGDGVSVRLLAHVVPLVERISY